MTVSSYPHKMAAAYHEAGHVVVQLYYDGSTRFRYARIFRRPASLDGEWDGVVEPLGGADSFRARLVRRAIDAASPSERELFASMAAIISLSGPLAERNFLSTISVPAQASFPEVFLGDVEEAAEFTQQILAIGASDARAFVLGREPIAAELVESHWAPINAVAKRISTEHRLSFAKCRSVAQRAGLTLSAGSQLAASDASGS